MILNLSSFSRFRQLNFGFLTSCHCNLFTRLSIVKDMSSQKTIVNFFKPVNKRINNESQDDGNVKKIKTADVEETVTEKQTADGKENVTEKKTADGKENITGTEKEEKGSEGKLELCMSPDQKNRMDQNRMKAEIKLQSKRTPALHDNMGVTWYMALKQEFSKPYFEKLSTFLVPKRDQATVYPPADQVYSWTHHCDLEDIKVVILGQDPYHDVGQAHGLCFSVQKGIRPPPSLLNMYKELETDIPGFTRPSHGHLIGWAKQGVLLLNACLTVTAHQANSHKDRGWEKFTDAVITAISKHNSGVVFLLWGAYAQKKAVVVDKKKHHLLSSTHPSPLSAHRGFLGNKHFSKCNELLQKGGKKPIDWCYLPLEL